MAKKMYIGVNGVARKIKQPYIGADHLKSGDANTNILLHGNTLKNQGNTAVSIINNGVTFGNSVSKFGKGSMYFNGSASLEIPLSMSGDLTVDFWMYFTEYGSNYPTPFQFMSGDMRGIYMHVRTAKTEFGASSASDTENDVTTTFVISSGAWHHIAFVRSGTTVKFYVDGVLRGTVNNSLTTNSKIIMGYISDNQSISQYKGYIEELRISNVVRWSGDFTPPSTQYVTKASDVAVNVKKGYIGVSGVARQFYDCGTPLGTFAVGSTVKLNVNGTPREFIIVNQGIPSNSPLYDSSCEGTWLLMKDLYNKRQWHSSGLNDYKNSAIHTYLNDTFFKLLDQKIQGIVKQVKIPYVNGAGANGVVASGASGLSTKVFLLSGYEMGYTTSSNEYVNNSTVTGFPIDGASLSYFSGIGDVNSKRIAYYNNSGNAWWLRSAYTKSEKYAWWIGTTGGVSMDTNVTGSLGIRPAFILPLDTLVSDDKQIIV